MLDALPLPPRPNIEQYRKQAKELLKACKSADAQALAAWVTQWLQAQLKIDPVSANARRAYTPGEIAQRIRSGPERVMKHLGITDGASRGACTLTRAQFALAREYGFASWPQFGKHIEALARANSPIAGFEAAADAVVSGDLAMLEKLLNQHPALVKARSMRGHGATLLHYVSANGVEHYRQKTPANIVQIAALLLRAGADVNAESEAYGGRSTTLGLTATSYHPEAAGVQLELLDLLLNGGAVIDPTDGGSAVNGCLRNGRGQAADFLASRGARLDLEGACGVGRLDVVKTFFDDAGQLIPPATQTQLNYGFAWACEFGRTDVVAFLLQMGMDADATLTQRGETGLHWAAHGAHVEIARLLLERATRIDIKDQSFQSTQLEWAIFAWSNAGEAKRSGYYEVVAMLVRAGATVDPKWYQGGANRQPVAKKIQSDPRMLAALRGKVLAKTSPAEKPAPIDTSLFLDLVRRIIAGDVGEVSRRLHAAPALATMALPIGATRQNAEDFFFPEIRHYLYGGDTALHMAAAAVSRPIAELLVAHGANCRARNRRGAEPLHYAADGNRSAAQAQVIEYLLSIGADPNAMDRSGVAPLHRAVRTRSLAAVRALLDGGAKPRLPNKNGSTPLHLAVQATGARGSGSDEARRQQAAIITLLLERGAKPTDKDARGKQVKHAASSEWIRTLLKNDKEP